MKFYASYKAALLAWSAMASHYGLAVFSNETTGKWAIAPIHTKALDDNWILEFN